MDPDKNIAVVIAAVNKINPFVTATSLRQAVDAFVTFFERPKDIPGEVEARLQKVEHLKA